ncbi:hypothetical protein C8N47_11924 [Mangrovibacterium marinum]|uniref:Polysaccharide lyase 14 domain-containing protein n=1 Tax=Mangrovibacterium marinum TaxID=1639118 RepID=A0A2T5BYJ6_9BACT|nr:hypothetical protein [Mangrovibacterium marinum]PTN07311.1 hypothetical protein C8N47_11924 [Mangrovibacterium marinum]
MKSHPFYFIILLLLSSACNKQTVPRDTGKLDFEQVAPGKLTDRKLRELWPGSRLLCGKKDFIFYRLGIDQHPLSIQEENNKHFLEVKIPAHHFGPITGAQWSLPVAPADEYFLSYSVRFNDHFNFVKGGKLPGLAGGTANTGGHVPSGYDGWSARMMFWENGKLSYYLYYPKQSGRWGERLYLTTQSGDTLQLQSGKWHRITQHIRMNEPQQADGLLEAWVDEQLVFSANNILFRKAPELQIDQILFSVFMGGDNLSWTSDKDQYICFDNFAVYTR